MEKDLEITEKAKKELAIKMAKQVLKDAGYLVVKPTKRQIADCKLCEKMSEQGEDMECIECSCSCCLFNA